MADQRQSFVIIQDAIRQNNNNRVVFTCVSCHVIARLISSSNFWVLNVNLRENWIVMIIVYNEASTPVECFIMFDKLINCCASIPSHIIKQSSETSPKEIYAYCGLQYKVRLKTKTNFNHSSTDSEKLSLVVIDSFK